MVHFCADDYGISKESNSRIEDCFKRGVLNKISVLPNGEISDFKALLEKEDIKISLHLNLIEGHPLSNPEEVDLLVADDGYFRYSFVGLLFLSLSHKREKLKKQLYKEIQNQIKFWKKTIGNGKPLSIDSHQHTHMIPLVFETLLEVLRDENVEVELLRIPSEPLTPYITTPSLYFSYSLVGIIKQWLLKILALVNKRKLKKSQIPYSCFCGVMFSGKMRKDFVEKLLPKYLKMAKKNNKDVEIGFHPGYLENGEEILKGCRKSFSKFYFSPWRKIEFDTLINLK